jgi:transposase
MSSARAVSVTWERLLGRKTMEVEILKEALDVARVKKPSLQLPSWNDRKDGSP